MDALRLFACRLAWLRYADVKAYEELVCAATDQNPEIRDIAQTFLAECAALKECSLAS